MSTQGTGVRPRHINHWTARLFNYNFTMRYRKSSNNVVAHALSRLPVPDTEDGMTFEEEIVLIVCARLTEKDFKEATVQDTVLPVVVTYISTSWPLENKLPPGFRSYFVVCDQLSITGGLLFQGEKINAEMQPNALTLLQTQSFGVSRLLLLLNYCLYISLYFKHSAAKCLFTVSVGGRV